MTYCNNCGAEIKNTSQKLCESCGSPLEPSATQSETASTQSTAMQPHEHPGGLFDINRNYYLFKKKYWDNWETLPLEPEWGSSDILDENNQVIGRMKRIIHGIRRRVELSEVDGSVTATIHAKIVSARGARDLKDPQGNLIARIKKKILSFFKSTFYLEDPNGNQWFRAQGEFTRFSFKIFDVTTGKVVAEIEKADKWRDVFLRGLLDFKDKYALKVLDNETDRRILLAFVLSIDNVLHDL